ncbi:MAG: M20/M25/M40 family metallo-hydrolase [Phycisphaerales bacterium]|nr:M20/M25/M40 family metallo-hydrolase [Phycisphaerales bacterium]
MTQSRTDISVSCTALSPVCERVARWSRIRSVSREEQSLADEVHRELAALGFQARRDGNNVWCEFGDATRPRLLLNSHIDTVPPAAGWSGDPWNVRIESDRVIGLGVNDAKGCGASLVETAVRIQRARDAGERCDATIVLALTAEEEISGQGLSAVLPRLQPLDAAIVGEPTGLAPMIAQRGLLVLRCVARGRTGHPANTPADTPNNAIANAAADIARLRGINWEPPHAVLGAIHAHVTMIAGGVARNVVPDSCEFWVDVRTTPTLSHREIVERVRAALSCEVNIHSERLTPIETAADEPIVRAAVVASGNPPAGSRTMSDMVFLRGVPSVKIGPGESIRSHTPDEFVMMHELTRGVDVYEKLIHEFTARWAQRD